MGTGETRTSIIRNHKQQKRKKGKKRIRCHMTGLKRGMGGTHQLRGREPGMQQGTGRKSKRGGECLVRRVGKTKIDNVRKWAETKPTQSDAKMLAAGQYGLDRERKKKNRKVSGPRRWVSEAGGEKGQN